MSTPSASAGFVFTPNNVGTLFVAQMPLGGQRHQLCDNAASYDVVCPLRCRIGIGPIPAQTGLRNFMAPVLATQRCAFTTRLRLTGVRPNSLANRTALS
jgi:hypothetical protein